MLGGAEACEERYLALRVPASQVQLSQHLLGVGYFGMVSLGTLSSSGKPHDRHRGKVAAAQEVAVKMVRADVLSGTRTTELLVEARLLASLDHPHLVRLLAISDDISLLLVMEYCEGGDLRMALRAGLLQQLPCPREVAQLDAGYQTAIAMEYLHSKLCLHRDLAARNVLVTTRGLSATTGKCGRVFKLADLGRARLTTSEADYYRVCTRGHVGVTTEQSCAVSFADDRSLFKASRVGVFPCRQAHPHNNDPYLITITLPSPPRRAATTAQCRSGGSARCRF